MANILVKLSSQEPSSGIVNSLKYGNTHSHLPSFLHDLGEVAGSTATASVQIMNNDAVAAHGTVTVAFASMTDGDKIQIGAMVLTAKALSPSTNEFLIDVSDAATAVNLSKAINAYSSSLLISSASAAVVTVNAASTGLLGNAIPMIVTQTTPGGMTPSAAALSGGLNDSATFVNYRSF